MTYYDRIAERWHGATGGDGGPFCRLVMNDLILGQIPSIEDRSILELGAGNGYFLPLLLDNFRGQGPSRVVVTDASSRLVATAESEFHIEDAEYQRLDVRARYPFEDGSFDLILAIHVFQEVSTAGLRKALAECHRVLTTDGRLIIAVTHPDFVQHLFEDRALRGTRTGQLTMPGPRSMRLPVVRRSASGYEVCLGTFGWEYQMIDVRPTKSVLIEQPELKATRRLPLALLFKCRKAASREKNAARSSASRSR